MPILYGLLAALGWGVQDYFVTCLARRVGTLRAMALIQSVSLMGWLLLLLVPTPLLWGRDSVMLWSGFSEQIGLWPVWAWMMGAGFCHMAGIALSYRAFEIGTLALVAPISSSFAVVTAVLATLTRENPPSPVMAGVGLLFIGVMLATRSPSHPEEAAQTSGGLRGVPEALGSAVAYGVMFWMMKPGENKIGPVLPLVVLKTVTTSGVLLSLYFITRRSVKSFANDSALMPHADTVVNAPNLSSLRTWLWPVIGVAVLDSLAWLAYNAGDRAGRYTTVVVALASLFSVITVLLAWILLKDRLSKIQWVGVCVISLGVLLVSLPESLFSKP